MPDGDHIELHSVDAPPGAPRVLVLHGLEGSLESHYVGGILSTAVARGWGATLLVFRGCGSTTNTARRFYHSGETSDLSHAFSVLRARWPGVPWHGIGVSLGGNVLLKWLGENGAASAMRTAAVLSVPFDLEAGARHIARGFARVYDRRFLRSLRRKALEKLKRYPDLCNRAALLRARSVFEFDEAVTAPVHGFDNARDYYAKSSSLAFLSGIRVPTLLLSAVDDPFLPRHVLARVTEAARANPALQVEFHPSGGHVGFVAGSFPWKPFFYAEWRVFRFFDAWVDVAR